MTSFVYPSNIPGLTFEVVRTPQWNTGVQEALSKKRSTIAYQAFPNIHFELTYELLRDDLSTSELKQIVGLFNACRGKFDTFLFTDPDFNTILSTSPQQFGVSDGVTANYQLVAAYQNSGGPGGVEIIQNLNSNPALYDNGTVIPTSGHYSVGPTGVINFSVIPTSGHVLTWSGSFYYRCAFDNDTIGVKKFMNKWWELETIAFTSILL